MVSSRKIWRDARGGMLVFFIVCLPVLVGAGGFVVDLTRVQTLQTQLQRVADSAALAAARELDYRNDALTRARAEAFGMPNKPTMAASAAGVQILEPTFYSSIDPDVESNDVLLVRYVRVQTVLRTSTGWFTKIFQASDGVADAVAWAESRIQACGAAPLFFCVNKGFNPTKGTQLLVKYTSSYGPGNFGLLDPPGATTGVSARLIEQNLASPEPTFCYTGALTVRTGQVAGPVTGGIGVRFDIYPTDNSQNSQRLRSYPPAPIVIKGKVPSGANNANAICSPQNYTGKDPNQVPVAMPRDPCIAAGTCWQGNGAWPREPYWTRNWGAQRPSNWQTMSRYETYLWELGITNETQAPQLRKKTGTSAENFAPACYTFKGVGTGPPATDARRRTINVAVVDCQTNVITGNSTPPLSIMRIARFFLTEPSSGTGDIYTEFIEWAEPGDGGIRHLVQLVR